MTTVANNSATKFKGPGSHLFLYDCSIARRPRIYLDNVPLHIVQRGHNREPCFFGEEDYQAYLHWLGEALVKEQCALNAYALMTNHVHLLIAPARSDAFSESSSPWAEVTCNTSTPLTAGPALCGQPLQSLFDPDHDISTCLPTLHRIQPRAKIRKNPGSRKNPHKNPGSGLSLSHPLCHTFPHGAPLTT